MKRLLKAFAIFFILPLLFLSACGRNDAPNDVSTGKKPSTENGELLHYKSKVVTALAKEELVRGEKNFYYEEDLAYISDLLIKTKDKINSKETDTKQAVDALAKEFREIADAVEPMKTAWILYSLQEAFDKGLLSHDDLVRISKRKYDTTLSGKKEAVDNPYVAYLRGRNMYLSEYLKPDEHGCQDGCSVEGTIGNYFVTQFSPLNYDIDITGEPYIVDGVHFDSFSYRLWRMASFKESKPMVVAKLELYVEDLWAENYYSEENWQIVLDLLEEAKQNINAESTDTYKKVVTVCDEAMENMNEVAPLDITGTLYRIQEAFDEGLLTHEVLERFAESNHYWKTLAPREEKAIRKAYSILLGVSVETILYDTLHYYGTSDDCYMVRLWRRDVDYSTEYQNFVVDGVEFQYRGTEPMIWRPYSLQ